MNAAPASTVTIPTTGVTELPLKSKYDVLETIADLTSVDDCVTRLCTATPPANVQSHGFFYATTQQFSRRACAKLFLLCGEADALKYGILKTESAFLDLGCRCGSKFRMMVVTTGGPLIRRYSVTF